MKNQRAAQLVSFLVLTCALQAPAVAGDWYLLGAVGSSTLDASSKSDLDGSLLSKGFTGLSSSYKRDDVGTKLQLGYQFSPHWALEGGYMDMGEARYTANVTGPVATHATAKLRVSGWSVAALGLWPLSGDFSLFAKLGVFEGSAHASSTQSSSLGSSSVSESANGSLGLWGVGGTYRLRDNLSLRAEYERLGGNSNNASRAELWSLGLAYRF